MICFKYYNIKVLNHKYLTYGPKWPHRFQSAKGGGGGEGVVIL